MTIYVDRIQSYTKIAPQARKHGKQWCHMFSDTSIQELQEFADRLGLRREWLQKAPILMNCHYDLVPSKRALAVKLGAVETTTREYIHMMLDAGKGELEP